ncbi:TadE/TadG family type IV pilus assembly protein [uncultured Hoeflea sp.]|jgi:Flp pilus assembly protein TadG|uniref:TadE/TadG family type IV pilus assembly protein n=1 Tax=uncultured Hoeflea sp. TaxID=538666 RepID=UPI0030D827AE|tara:strand:- start:712 stop:1320 length:609 start_codon:yes stop_codon:yes gene_type:complete
MVVDDQSSTTCKAPRRLRRMLARWQRSRDGSTAIEFALLAFPFFLLIFATIEAFIAFAGEQLLENAVDTMARQIRTGQIKNLSEEEFRTKFCAEINLMIKCAAEEDPDNQKLYLDVREFATFAAIPNYIPKQSGSQFSDLDSSEFAYSPGGPKSINIVRAYYRWEVMTDLVRPFITNIRKDGEMPRDYLMVATAAFRNENFP